MKFNGKEFKVPEFTFNTMIDLEDRGVQLADLNDTPMKFIRALMGITLGVSNEEAGMQIQKHIEAGNKLDELVQAITESITESGFIKALQNE